MRPALWWQLRERKWGVDDVDVVVNGRFLTEK